MALNYTHVNTQQYCYHNTSSRIFSKNNSNNNHNKEDLYNQKTLSINPSSYNQILLSIKASKKIINLTGTKYPIIKQIALKQQYQIASDHYLLLWTDFPLSIKQIRQLDSNKKVNHIPQVTELTRKNKLAKNLNAMKAVLPREYTFYPQTWILPSDYHKIVKKHQKGKYYIVKPQNGSQGKGIYLVDNPSKLQKYTSTNNLNYNNLSMTGVNFRQQLNNTTNLNSGQIVQQYISNPLLIDSLKFDLRIYALITCVSPLRIYLYQQGLARFATQQFKKPQINNLQNAFSHLTNYSINKNNSCFLVDNDNFSTGHKRLFSSFLQTNIFSKELYDKIFKQIGDIIIKTIISALPSLQNGYTQCRKNDPNSCFQLLGFDIILDDNYKPYLLQVNQNPSLSTDTSLDYVLKSQLVNNIFQLVCGNISCSTDEKFETKIKNKDKYQLSNLGKFQRIYPSCIDLQVTQRYDNLIYRSNQVYKDKFGINIIRSSTTNKRKKQKQQTNQDEIGIQWNQAPSFYSKQKLSKVYGGKDRNTKTSQFRRRVIFY